LKTLDIKDIHEKQTGHGERRRWGHDRLETWRKSATVTPSGGTDWVGHGGRTFGLMLPLAIVHGTSYFIPGLGLLEKLKSRLSTRLWLR
jgi:hypothetical protein